MFAEILLESHVSHVLQGMYKFRKTNLKMKIRDLAGH